MYYRPAHEAARVLDLPGLEIDRRRAWHPLRIPCSVGHAMSHAISSGWLAAVVANACFLLAICAWPPRDRN